MMKLSPTENILCQMKFSPIGITLQWKPWLISRDAWAGPIQEWGERRNRNLAIRVINVRVLQEQMRWAPLMRTLHIFSSYWSCAGQRANVAHSITVAILAQGTSWAVAVTQALSVSGLRPQASVRTLPAHTQAIFATPWTLARPRLWDRSPTGRVPLTTSTSMWVRQAARLLLTCQRVFCQCQACNQNP
jgi:hypothetical protein